MVDGCLDALPPVREDESSLASGLDLDSSTFDTHQRSILTPPSTATILGPVLASSEEARDDSERGKPCFCCMPRA